MLIRFGLGILLWIHTVIHPLKPFEDADELIEKTSKLFHRMDGELGEMFDTMRDGGYSLDLDSRKGKAPGGYQASRDRKRKPFIFMNAASLPRDLDTMVHEAGHAFHYMLCRHDDLVWYRGAPLEFAEVASMSMEMLSYPFLEEFYTSEETKRAIQKHLEGIVNFLPWCATIDAFSALDLSQPRPHTRRTNCPLVRTLQTLW